ncbi:MAG TPA: alpha-ketoacid dehydrogenase subunit beta [Rhodospirillales bacterium]|mgnify:CR=1 FL=1|nr:alpha-ketoacid dehydrogenase subunit beta [Rhodospirillales bacterium]
MPERILTYVEAVREAFDICLERDANVYLMGEGVADLKGVFGTTLGLLEKYGPDRVVETPTAENGMTGVAIGSALMGQRPVMMHQRVDFSLLAFDQIVNNAANWHYMYGGKGGNVPIVIRVVIGQGWGQGAQHAQCLEPLFAHIPGLKVVMPATAGDAKGLMIAAIEDPNPVIYIDHRWLHHTTGHVPEGHYASPIKSGRVARGGKDVTVVATSHMVIQALRAAEVLAEAGCELEVIDLMAPRPLDMGSINKSVAKTGRLVTVDTGWRSFGVGAEIVSRVAESGLSVLKAAPKRLGLPDHPTPSSRALVVDYYPRAETIIQTVGAMMVLDMKKVSKIQTRLFAERAKLPIDIPDSSFTGPF